MALQRENQVHPLAVALPDADDEPEFPPRGDEEELLLALLANLCSTRLKTALAHKRISKTLAARGVAAADDVASLGRFCREVAPALDALEGTVGRLRDSVSLGDQGTWPRLADRMKWADDESRTKARERDQAIHRLLEGCCALPKALCGLVAALAAPFLRVVAVPCFEHEAVVPLPFGLFTVANPLLDSAPPPPRISPTWPRSTDAGAISGPATFIGRRLPPAGRGGRSSEFYCANKRELPRFTAAVPSHAPSEPPPSISSLLTRVKVGQRDETWARTLDETEDAEIYSTTLGICWRDSHDVHFKEQHSAVTLTVKEIVLGGGYACLVRENERERDVVVCSVQPRLLPPGLALAPLARLPPFAKNERLNGKPALGLLRGGVGVLVVSLITNQKRWELRIYALPSHSLHQDQEPDHKSNQSAVVCDTQSLPFLSPVDTVALEPAASVSAFWYADGEEAAPAAGLAVIGGERLLVGYASP